MITKTFLFSTTPGINVKESLKSLSDFFEESKIKTIVYNFENYLVKCCTVHLKKQYPEFVSMGFSLLQALTLPFSELSNSATQAFMQIVEEIKKLPYTTDMAILIHFHPVYYHQRDREFVSPMINSEINEILKSQNLRISAIISLHDDIFEYVRNLMVDGKLLNPQMEEKSDRKPPRVRDPNKDIYDLIFMLNWRDRELTSATNKAKSFSTKHLLFHNKGRVKSLFRIIWKDERHIYFSHPISQPRKDLNGLPNEKFKKPFKLRGETLINEIQSFADCLALKFAIVEPTCIDELRTNLDELKKISITDLKSSILPPLYKRWPIGNEQRVGLIKNDEDENILIGIEAAIYDPEKYKYDEQNFMEYKNPLNILIKEIGRQINVRDHRLANQADRIIAFRPFSHPDTPTPTGGVQEEIETLKRRINLDKTKVQLNALLIINTNSDELRRRKNEFKQAWPNILKDKLEIDSKLETKFSEELQTIILQLDDSTETISESILELFNKHHVTVKSMADPSSMPATGISEEDFNRRLFTTFIINKTAILKSQLQKYAEEQPDYIKFISNYTSVDNLMDEVCKLCGN